MYKETESIEVSNSLILPLSTEHSSSQVLIDSDEPPVEICSLSLAIGQIITISVQLGSKMSLPVYSIFQNNIC